MGCATSKQAAVGETAAVPQEANEAQVPLKETPAAPPAVQSVADVLPTGEAREAKTEVQPALSADEQQLREAAASLIQQVTGVSQYSGLGWAGGAYSEEERLKCVLDSCAIQNRPRLIESRRLEKISALTRSIFGIPMVSISVLAGDVQIPLDADYGPLQPRDAGMCQWTLHPPAPKVLVVEDARRDVRMRTLPWVTGPPGIRFYAGVPLLSTDDAYRYGTICMIDMRPRKFAAEQYNLLTNLAELAVREIEFEKKQRLESQQVQQRSAELPLVRSLAAFGDGVAVLQIGGGNSLGDWTVLYSNDNWSDAVGGGVDPPAAFWEHFVAAPGACEATAADLAAGRPFTMTVKDVHAHELEMDFRPAATEQIAAHMPLIGIPGTIHWGARGSKAAGAEGRPAAEGSTGAVFWFAIVRHRRPASDPDPSSSSDPHTPNREELAQAAALHAASQGSTLLQPESTVPGGFPTISAYVPAALVGVVVNSIALGSGAMSRVYRGMYQQHQVAVKVMDRQLPGDGRLPPALEAALSPDVQHPSVVQTLLYGVEHQEDLAQVPYLDPRAPRLRQLWLVQQFCDRGTLIDAIERGWLQDEQGLPYLPAIVRTAHEVASGVAYLHSRTILHGALHNGNVLLCSTGTSTSGGTSSGLMSRADSSGVGSRGGSSVMSLSRAASGGLPATPSGETAGSPGGTEEMRGFVAQVSDYGLAVSEASTRIGKGFLRSVTHQSPEVLDGGAHTKAADVYSFGVLLHEMWTGTRAWLGKRSTNILLAVTQPGQGLQAPDDAPEALRTLMQDCLAFDPGERPTFAQVVQQLQELLPPAA